MKTFLHPQSVTFFRDNETMDVYFIKDNGIHRFEEIDQNNAVLLRKLLLRQPSKLNALKKSGILDPLEQLKVFAGCTFGAISFAPDLINQKRFSYNYTPCPNKDNDKCPFNHVLCDKGKFMYKNTYLTKQEVRVLSEITRDVPEISVAKKLNISIQTLKKHSANIRNKLSLRSVKGLVSFALNHHIL